MRAVAVGGDRPPFRRFDTLTEPANRSQSAIAGKFGAIAEKSKPPEACAFRGYGRGQRQGSEKWLT